MKSIGSYYPSLTSPKKTFHCPWISQVYERVISNSKDSLVIFENPNPSETVALLNSLSLEEFCKIPNIVVNVDTPFDLSYSESFFPLTIGFTMEGSVIVATKEKQFALNKNSYLIMNYGKFLTEFKAKTSAFRICFNLGFAEEVLKSLTTKTDYLLENPYEAPKQPVWFFEKAHFSDSRIIPLLKEIRTTVLNQPYDEIWLNEKLHILLERMLFIHRNILKEIQKLPAIKKSTRLELYRRINLAKDYIDDSITEPMTLEQMAKIASLSKHHFLRLFKQTFKETPYQYLIRRRLERFKSQRLQSNRSITEVCYQSGFEDLRNLERLFQKRFGISPRKYKESHC